MVENTGNQGTKTDFRSEFEALPLDQKFSSLFQMEVATLNEAFKYVADSSMKVLEKVGDAIGDLGIKIETEARKAADANKEKNPVVDNAVTEEPPPKKKPRAAKGKSDQI